MVPKRGLVYQLHLQPPTRRKHVNDHLKMMFCTFLSYNGFNLVDQFLTFSIFIKPDQLQPQHLTYTLQKYEELYTQQSYGKRYLDLDGLIQQKSQAVMWIPIIIRS